MSSLDIHDEMRPIFGPLLSDLNAGQGKNILVAGGYGLFLKQIWLLGNPDVPVIVPISQWRDNTPRVTKDLDLVVGLDLISNAEAQKEILKIIAKHGFKVSEKNPRWQFIKVVSETRNVIVELHAPFPADNERGLQADRIRVKRKPSLGDRGFHARTNPEAIGSELSPFGFEVEGMAIQVPNPVTWSIMKLTAADDRWKHSENPDNTEEFRSFSRVQAIKHAQDVLRLVAMVNRDESDAAPVVVDAVKTTSEFKKAALIVAESFAHGEQWVSQVLSENWSAESLTLIRDTLGGWFSQTA